MKKLLCLTLALCMVLLSACSRGADEEPPQQTSIAATPTPVPEEGSHGEMDQSLALEAMPTLEPVQALDSDSQEQEYFSFDAMMADGGASDAASQTTAAPEAPIPAPQPAASGAQPRVDTSTYQYSALIDTSLGFTFNYPSHWQNVPGVYTVCYREVVEKDDFPARVAISAKKLVHTPDENAINTELTAYMRMIYRQYEPSTFQAGTPNTEDTFMGKRAFSNTYLAYSGEHEVKGFIIATASGRTMYVFHFCATYEDYGAMESMMRYMVNSVTLIEA